MYTLAIKKSGIYKIRNKTNGKFYLGSSCNIIKRKYTHYYELRHNKHPNQILQRAWNKYGEAEFEFIIVCETSEDLLGLEQTMLDTLKPDYNIALFAISGMRGRKHSEETKELLRQRMTGRVLDQEWRDKISKAHMGKTQQPHTEESKLKMSKAQRGKKMSPESIEKMRIAHTGKVLSPEHCRKNGEAHSKAVVRIDPETGEEKHYNSMTQAKVEGGFDQSNIGRCCNGAQIKHKGYYWKYLKVYSESE